MRINSNDRIYLITLSLFILLTIGCTEPLHHNLAENEANEMVVVLTEYGMTPEKLRDPVDPERWAIKVPTAQRVDAWGILQDEGIPRPPETGFGDFYPGSGLIPTAQEERVVLQYATARELQSSLLRVDGVVDAHVHLVLPEKPRLQLSNTILSPPRASVLLQWRDRDGAPPLTTEEIKALISGGVEGLEADSVHVVMTAIQTRHIVSDKPNLVSIGPLMVAPASQGPIKILVLMMGAIIILLSAALAFVLLTARRTDTSEVR